MQAETTRFKQSTIVSQMKHANRMRNTTKHLNINLHVITHDNSSMKKKHFLDYYYPIYKPTKEFK